MKKKPLNSRPLATTTIIASATASTLAHATSSETALSLWAKQQQLAQLNTFVNLCERVDFRQQNLEHCWQSIKILHQVSRCKDVEQTQDFYRKRNVQQEMLFSGGGGGAQGNVRSN